MVVDVADSRVGSLKIKATEVIERTGNKMIEMRTQPSGFCRLEKTAILNDTCPILRASARNSIQVGTEGTLAVAVGTTAQAFGFRHRECLPSQLWKRLALRFDQSRVPRLTLPVISAAIVLDLASFSKNSYFQRSAGAVSKEV